MKQKISLLNCQNNIDIFDRKSRLNICFVKFLTTRCKLDCMEDNIDKEIRRYLEMFREKEVGAFNNPISMENGVTIILEHWLQSDEELRVSIVLPKRVPSPRQDQHLSSLAPHFNEIADDLNKILEDCGYKPPNQYLYTGKKEGPFEPQQYKFQAKVQNPNIG